MIHAIAYPEPAASAEKTRGVHTPPKSPIPLTQASPNASYSFLTLPKALTIPIPNTKPPPVDPPTMSVETIAAYGELTDETASPAAEIRQNAMNNLLGLGILSNILPPSGDVTTDAARPRLPMIPAYVASTPRLFSR